MPKQTQIIMNPRAGSGRALTALRQLTSALDAHGAEYRVTQTERPQDGARLSREARLEGVDQIAVVGGDGTIHEVVQGYLENGEVVPGPKLGLVPAGTGGDFRKTFGLSNEPGEAARRLLEGKPRKVDVGLAKIDALADTQAFLNILSFGISGHTDLQVSRGPKWLGGKPAFFLGTLQAMVSYRNQPVRVAVDGQVVAEGPIFTVAVANGRYFGGGMQIAPEADPCDGLLDVVILGDLTLAESLALAPLVYSGAHKTRAKVSTFRGKRIEARPLRDESPVLIDADGETPGKLPLEAWVAPGSLELLL